VTPGKCYRKETAVLAMVKRQGKSLPVIGQPISLVNPTWSKIKKETGSGPL